MILDTARRACAGCVPARLSSRSVTHQPAPPAPGRVVVMLSGTGTLLQALLDAERDGSPGYSVVGVVADRAEAQGLVRAHDAGVATAVVEVADHPDRAGWDVAVAQAVEAFRPDLVVLAGFMRILGFPFLDRYGGRAVNTHPALLPAFPGAHAVRDALAYGAKITGCTVMLVDAGTDTGPVIAQEAVRVEAGDDEESLHERIKVAERALLVQVVARMMRSGWTVHERTVRLG